MTTPHQEDAIATMREVLQDDFLTLQVLRSTATEDFASGTCRLQAVVSAEPLAAEAEIDAEGVGVVAAFFDGLRARFAPEHPSLRSLSFSSFDVRGLIEESGDGDRSNAHARVTVGITNSYGNEFLFASVTPSVERSSLQAVANAVCYFINSERAYVTMYNALQHYRSTGRTDLVAKYTTMLGGMVRNTSYSEVLERLPSQG